MKNSVSSNHRLPAEILQEIFKQLQVKNELKTCLLVCKAWNLVAKGFFSPDINIQISDMALIKLYKDLPAFGEKVKRITLKQLSTGAESPVIFRSALNMCPNLIELHFNFTDIYEYLKALNCHEAVLPNIQKIKVLDLKACSPAVRRFHLWVNFRFRATITSLEIDDLEENGALNNYGGLIKLVSTFPNLTYLRGKCHSIVERELCIDLTGLLLACPKLQELKLYGIGKIMNHVKDIPESESALYPKLEKLKLKVAQIDIRLLEYIATRFKNVDNLRLITFNILADYSLKPQDSEKILKDFEAYYKNMKRVNVNYKYGTSNYLLNRGKIRSVDSNAIRMMGLPEGFMLNEAWAGGDWLDADEDDDSYYYDQLFEEQEDYDYDAGDYVADMELTHMLYQHLLDHIEDEEDVEDDSQFNEDTNLAEEELFRAYYSL